MRWRVVCAFGVTMDSFCPKIPLSRVLFPAFGFPIIATKPACRSMHYVTFRRGPPGNKEELGL